MTLRVSLVSFRITLGAGAVLFAAFWLSPAHVWQHVVLGAAGFAAAATALLRRHDGDARLWRLYSAVTVGLALMFGLTLLGAVARSPAFDTASFALGMLLYLPTLALVLWIAARRGPADRAGWLDALAMTLGLGLAVWILVYAEPFRANVHPALAIFPAMDLILVGAAVRLILAGGTRSPAALAMAATLGVNVVGDTFLLLSELEGDPLLARLANAGFVLGLVLWVATSSHPSSAELATPLPGVAQPALSRARWLVLSAAALAGPIALVAQSARGRPADDTAALSVSIVLSLLVLWRLADLSQRMRREERLHLAAMEATLARLREREAELVQASKMAAVGQLAAGVAHEINNPLTVIVGFAQGLQRRLPTLGEELRVPVESILRQAQRAAAIAKELLSYAREDRSPAGAVDLGELLRDTAEQLAPRAGQQGTRLEVDTGGAKAQVHGSRTRLQQVLLNLGQNALDAVEHDGEVVLRLGAPDDGLVAVSVEDTGPGIAPGDLPRIFEPFFTTKPVGKGTGLGLSLAYEIVRQHRGRIEVDSAPGRGARMRVVLPTSA